MENQIQLIKTQKEKVVIFENYRYLIHSKNFKAVYLRCFLFRSINCETRMVLTADFKKLTRYPGMHTHNDERNEISMEVFRQKKVKKAKKKTRHIY